MVFLIDILHPAHVHFFKHAYHYLTDEGHKVIVTAREKEISTQLLDACGMEYILISTQKHGVGLIWEMILRTVRLYRICLKYRPALLLGIMGPSIAVAGFILRISSWVFYDTENAGITNWFVYPLAKRVYTPECYRSKKRKNQITYQGYHELAYLHPTRFTPDISVVRCHGIDTGKPFFIVRFVGWQASHDLGERGISDTNKVKLVTMLEQYGVVYISSEAPLPDVLKSKVLTCPAEDIHHMLAFARIVVGESATMASEAAVLGVPAFFISDTLRGYTIEEEERYGLVRNFSNRELECAMQVIEKMAGASDTVTDAQAARARLLAERIDVTEYILDEIRKTFGT